MSREDSGIHILLVDDHAMIRGGLRLLIESRPGWKVVAEAGTCAESLDLAARHQPDIVLLDLALGAESTVDVIPALLDASPSTRVIVLTGLQDPRVHQEAIGRGALGLVMKDRASEVLLKAIERVNAGEVWIDRKTLASVLARKAAPKDDPEAAKIEQLTRREREVIRLLGEGLRSRQIADRLFISEATVRHHLTSIFSKLEVADRFELLIYALRHGLAKLPAGSE